MAEYTLHIDLSNIPSDNEEAKEQLEKFNDPNKVSSSTDEKEIPFKKTVKGMALYMAADTVQNVARDVMSYPLTTYGARYGDTARQNQINNIMTQVNMVGGIASSTASGAIAGSAVGGPIGAAVGAAIGAVSSMISEVVQGFQRVDEWNRTQQLNNMNEVRQSERLGLMASDRNRGRGR